MAISGPIYRTASRAPSPHVCWLPTRREADMVYTSGPFHRTASRVCLCVPPCRRLDTYLPDPTSPCVLNFGRPSLEISKELDQQNKMLDNVNTDLEEAIGGLDVVTKKTKDLIKKSGEGGGFLRLSVQWSVVLIDDTPVCNAVPVFVLCEPGFRSGEASNVRHRSTYHLDAASSAGLGQIVLRWFGLGWVRSWRCTLRKGSYLCSLFSS